MNSSGNSRVPSSRLVGAAVAAAIGVSVTVSVGLAGSWHASATNPVDRKTSALQILGTHQVAPGNDKLNGGAPTFISEEAWELGVFADPEAPFSSSVFLATSRWVGLDGSRYTVLYAGSDGQNPANGAAQLMHYRVSDGLLIDARPLNVPAGQGALTVASADGGLVQLQSADGTAHVFHPLLGALT